MNFSFYKHIIQKYKFVSFDIFDTLVVRDCVLPSDIFAFAGREVLGSGMAESFRLKRMKAEKAARLKDPCQEPNLLDIYEQLNAYNTKYIDRLYHSEIDQELQHCFVKEHVIDLYRYALNEKKTVFLISDMYLSKYVIEEILRKCGIYGYKKLYLSNVCKCNKRNGSLFQFALNDNYINSSQIVHIGDDFKSDIIGAKKVKIKALPIYRQRAITRFIKGKEIQRKL